MEMNKDTLRSRWNEIKGRLKAKWAKLTDDDLDYAEGRFDEIKGRLQNLYGYSKERVEKEVEDTVRDFRNYSRTSEEKQDGRDAPKNGGGRMHN